MERGLGGPTTASDGFRIRHSGPRGPRRGEIMRRVRIHGAGIDPPVDIHLSARDLEGPPKPRVG